MQCKGELQSCTALYHTDAFEFKLTSGPEGHEGTRNTQPFSAVTLNLIIITLNEVEASNFLKFIQKSSS